MMKSYLHIQSLVLAFAILSFSACSNDGLLQMDGEKATVTFQPKLDGVINTRSIGDATQIDQLVVTVYEGTDTKSKVLSKKYDWTFAKTNGVSLTLIEGRTYHILFWAEHKDNGAYTLTEDGKITVNYNNYFNGGFADMEKLDVFCNTQTVTVGTDKVENKGVVTLSRPLAQVNFADNTTQPTSGTHKALVTFHDIPTSYNPFTGEIASSEGDICFTFSDFTNECLSVNNSNYYYVSCNYVFAPQTGTASVKATLDLKKVADDTSIRQVSLDNITIEQNKRTNILGAIIQTFSVWNGTIPTSSTITKDDQNHYVIDGAEDIAWLSSNNNASSLNANSTFLLTTDIDMDNRTGLSTINLPLGSTFYGGGHTIKGLKLKNGLFGDATDITVENLNIEYASVSNTSSNVTNVGILANTISGTSTFSNVNVSNSSVSTNNGAAGGIVGYVSRQTDNSSETLTVTFDDCHVTSTTVSGTESEGYFVGLLRGYDNGETLQFNDNCTLSLTQTRSVANESPYREGNEAVWLASNDYSKYNGWLGNEECYRGIVMYGTNRFIPCWDGTTKVTPLMDGTTKLIYSAFDLAACEGTNPGTIRFLENVDMGSKVFNPLTGITKLSGEDKTIYNLKVETTFDTNSWDGGGFVRRCTAATIENITFNNADVKVTHIEGSDGDAYASIVCGTAEGTNTMTNVKVVGGKLYGCNKMGGIAGYITGTFNASNCIVDGLSIENYDSGGKDNLGFKANGEVGGAFGFIAANSTITGCYVKNTTLNCVGIDNGKVLVFLKYAGRHVNEFIGDIRTTSGQTIRISYTESDFTGNTYKNRKDQYSECKYIGHCYYTSVNALVAKIEDTKGIVYVNDKSITVAKNY